MITEEQLKKAEKVIADYKAEQLNKSYVIKSFPSDDEIHKESLRVCRIEAEFVQGVAWCYHDKGAKWMMEELKKRGNVL